MTTDSVLQGCNDIRGGEQSLHSQGKNLMDNGSAESTALWRQPLNWLRRAPISDPIDRRNAPMLQIALLLIGGPPPLMWLYRALVVDLPWRDGELRNMVMSLLTCAAALGGVVLVRRGYYQWAIRPVLALVAVFNVLAYATEGMRSQWFEDPLLVVWIVLSGLVVGRWALWAMFGAVVIACVAGGYHDAHVAGAFAGTSTQTMIVVSRVVIFLLVAIVVDSGIAALRGSLTEASQRSDALAVVNRRLEAEMTERRRVEEQLVHSRKVEAVGQLASGVAHDFNHLLALTMGYVAKARDNQDPAELRQALTGIESAMRRASALTRKLLDFGSQTPACAERFDATAALHDVMPMLRQMFDPRVRITSTLPERALPIFFDRARFDLLVLNIAANANQAMPEGGEFRLTLASLDDRKQVEIKFSDSGCGMTEEVKVRAFEPLFTTSADGRGMGLGLTVTRAAIVEHGGSISVDSVPGRGTTFRVLLPMAGA